MALQPAKDAPAETEQQATTPTVEADEELQQLFAERDDALYSGDTKKTAELNMKIFTVQQERATQAAIARIDARNSEQAAQKPNGRRSARWDECRRRGREVSLPRLQERERQPRCH